MYVYIICNLVLCMNLSPKCAGEKEALYGTIHQEAVLIFNALLTQECLADPIKQIQEIVQKCFDIEDLQSEVQIFFIFVE